MYLERLNCELADDGWQLDRDAPSSLAKDWRLDVGHLHDMLLMTLSGAVAAGANRAALTGPQGVEEQLA